MGPLIVLYAQFERLTLPRLHIAHSLRLLVDRRLVVFRAYILLCHRNYSRIIFITYRGGVVLNLFLPYWARFLTYSLQTVDCAGLGRYLPGVKVRTSPTVHYLESSFKPT